MQRRHFIYLGLGVAALAGCGNGPDLGGTSPGGGPSGTLPPGSTVISGRIILPAGSGLSFDGLKVVSGFSPATVSADGSFSLPQFSQDAALILLLDGQGRVLLLGFSGSTSPNLEGEISPLQTSVALLFLALGAFTLPAQEHQRVRRLLQEDSRVQNLGRQLDSILASNPYALADGDQALMGQVNSLRDILFPSTNPATSPKQEQAREGSSGTQIQTTPENELSGYLAAANGNGGGLTITNTRRRNALVTIYETAYVEQDPNNPILPNDATFHRVARQEIFFGTYGLAGVVGSLTDYFANGVDSNGNTTSAYGPVTSGPYDLDLFPATATRVEYQVEIIANGNGGDSSGLLAKHIQHSLDFTPLESNIKICFLTFVKDVLLPAIATFCGLQSSLKLDLRSTGDVGLPSSELLKNFDDLAVILSGVVDSGIAITQENVRGLLIAVLKAIGNNATLRQKFLDWLFGVFFRQGLTSGTAGVLAENLAAALNAIIIVVDKILGAADLGAVLTDWARSETYMLFTARAIQGRVTLSPQTADVPVGGVQTLTATTTAEGNNITFHWRIVSGIGTLRNPISGASGSNLDSASPEIRYEAPSDAIGGERVVIEVEAFIGAVNDPDRATIDTAGSTLTILASLAGYLIQTVALPPSFDYPEGGGYVAAYYPIRLAEGTTTLVNVNFEVIVEGTFNFNYRVPARSTPIPVNTAPSAQQALPNVDPRTVSVTDDLTSQFANTYRAFLPVFKNYGDQVLMILGSVRWDNRAYTGNNLMNAAQATAALDANLLGRFHIDVTNT